MDPYYVFGDAIPKLFKVSSQLAANIWSYGVEKPLRARNYFHATRGTQTVYAHQAATQTQNLVNSA